jgi:anti-sigma factor RsiW
MTCNGLSWDLLVRAVDKELSQEEERLVAAHLSECGSCRREYVQIEDLSLDMQTMVSRVTVAAHEGDRAQLEGAIRKHETLHPLRHAPERVMRRFGWGMALAATLALGIILAPKPKSYSGESAQQAASLPGTGAASSAIEVDGETFIALPYSNPDLPVSAPRIVQMQVPVSSLTDVGIAVEPVANDLLNQDRAVLADVLLGADGQPMGVHVVSWE